MYSGEPSYTITQGEYDEDCNREFYLTAYEPPVTTRVPQPDPDATLNELLRRVRREEKEKMDERKRFAESNAKAVCKSFRETKCRVAFNRARRGKGQR